MWQLPGAPRGTRQGNWYVPLTRYSIKGSVPLYKVMDYCTGRAIGSYVSSRREGGFAEGRQPSGTRHGGRIRGPGKNQESRRGGKVPLAVLHRPGYGLQCLHNEEVPPGSGRCSGSAGVWIRSYRWLKLCAVVDFNHSAASRRSRKLMF